MGSYQFKKKKNSSDLNSYLFHTEWPPPSAFPPCRQHRAHWPLSRALYPPAWSFLQIQIETCCWNLRLKQGDAVSEKERVLPTSCRAASWVSQIQQRGPGSLYLQFLSALACAVCSLPSVISANCEFIAGPLARSTSRLLLYYHPVPWDQPSQWGQPSNDINSTKDIHAFVSSQEIPVSSWAAKSTTLYCDSPVKAE